ncbi:MAG: glutamate-1-semialdehyde 2,1-aminomutase [Proteobacteria bacterium]|nr:glutamate-1-semialdehyde 2,1-aminomutase [Pseudomonadota bacterium]
MAKELSKRLFERAIKILPGGVDSPVRAFKAVGGIPLFTKKAEGAYLFDVDNNKYIDYVGSWGPMILGHNHPEVVAAIENALKDGTSFGTSSEREIILAELVLEAFPSIEMVRFVNSGTEATMSAIRVARGYTKKNKIIKFNGCYHGHADGLLVKAGSGAETFGIPDSLGVPEDYAKNTLVAEFNDIESVKSLFERYPDDIACVILEPVVGNMGVLIPKDGFLKNLRELTKKYGALLIFDEVMTGFRLSYGGAQAIFNIDPDLTCLGKIIGGGLPVGAYGGKREIMELVAPSGPVYQAGTLSGNPLAMSAGIATLKALKANRVYEKINTYTKNLCESINNIFEGKIPVKINLFGSMFTIFFTNTEVYDYNTAKTSNTQLFGKFFNLMLENGVFLPPSQFEAAFVSYAHGDMELNKTLEAVEKAVKQLT